MGEIPAKELPAISQGSPASSEDLTQLLLGVLNGPPVPGDSPALAGALLRDALRERATDIHLDPRSGGTRVRLRIDGQLRDAALLTRDQTNRLINQLKGLARLDPVTAFIPVESRFTHAVDGHEIDLRITATPCLGGEKVSIRLLDPVRVKLPLHDLGLMNDDLDVIAGWLRSVNGMFVVAGPTGSGKTTTLYALLDVLKVERRSIITIEDPIEYQIDGITQVQLNERRGMTFASGLKSMLRLDPDYGQKRG
jgi:general secretion pathway protein E